jgi:hypothetical protein
MQSWFGPLIMIDLAYRPRRRSLSPELGSPRWACFGSFPQAAVRGALVVLDIATASFDMHPIRLRRVFVVLALHVDWHSALSAPPITSHVTSRSQNLKQT